MRLHSVNTLMQQTVPRKADGACCATHRIGTSFFCKGRASCITSLLSAPAPKLQRHSGHVAHGLMFAECSAPGQAANARLRLHSISTWPRPPLQPWEITSCAVTGIVHDLGGGPTCLFWPFQTSVCSFSAQGDRPRDQQPAAQHADGCRSCGRGNQRGDGLWRIR